MGDYMDLKQYIPFEKKEFRPHQEEAINDILKSIEEGNKFTILNAPVGVGKAFSLDTIVPTDNGFKKIKDIKIGDYVFNDHGQKVKVLNKSQIWYDRPCFRITFKNGFEVIADENHEWICNYNVDSKQTKEFRKRSTKEMYENYRTKEKYRHYIKKPSPMQYSKKQLPIPPYTLGIWLSDGTATCSDITVNNQDLSIWDEIENEGFHISDKYRPKGNANTSAILNFHHLLVENNLIKNKHIPDCYLNASYKDRLSLVQGLIDGDGHVDQRGQVEFSNNNYQIVKSLKILLASFGIETRITSRIPKLNGKPCSRNYRLNFVATQDIPVTRLSRYKKNIRKPKRQWNTTYAIYSIEPVGLYDTVCIQVEGGIFCVGEEYIPTHNSLIGYVLAKKLEEDGLHTYLCTGTKILQSQYIQDFKDVKTIKGRANFQCYTEPLLDCANGMCQSRSNFHCESKPILKEDWIFDGAPLPCDSIEIDGIKRFYGDPEFDEMFTKNMCPYWKQKINGIMSPITMLNYDYLISDLRFVQHLPHRKLLVADEAHNIEKILMRQLETSFSPSAVFRETDFMFKESVNIVDWIEQVAEVADRYKKRIKTVESERTKKRMEEKYHKFVTLHTLLEDNPANWVFIKDKNNKGVYYTFKPIMVSEYSRLIFSIAEHVLLMTGTVLKQDIFARDLGINDFSYIEIPSVIPSCNRPIVKMYAGPMSKSSIDATMPNMIATIKMLAEKHKNEKGLISTYTYSIANKLQKALRSDNRFMFHDQNNKEKVFERFKKNKTNKILVSPVAFEGVDFLYDEARFHLIVKDPFPNLGDRQLSIRDNIDYGYIFRERCRVLSQAYGRCNRASDDHSITYLLDSRLESLLGPSTLVTSYFLEGLVDMRYEDTLVLTDDAYSKLTKDNKRKTHDFEREVELHILHDIEDGYDSLEKLHIAYKQFPSDSYKYIIPGVNRLLKHGAIKYK